MSSNTPLTYTTAATNFEFEVWQLKVCFSLFACQDIGDLVWPLHFEKKQLLHSRFKFYNAFLIFQVYRRETTITTHLRLQILHWPCYI